MSDPLRAITLAADSIGALAVMTARWEERTTWVDETNALLTPLERALWQLEHLERTAQHIAALRDEAAQASPLDLETEFGAGPEFVVLVGDGVAPTEPGLRALMAEPPWVLLSERPISLDEAVAFRAKTGARAAWATFDPSHLGVPEPFKPFANRVSQRLYAYELRGGQFVRVAAPTEPVTLERLPTSSALPVSRIALTFASTDAFSAALL